MWRLRMYSILGLDRVHHASIPIHGVALRPWATEAVPSLSRSGLYATDDKCSSCIDESVPIHFENLVC